MAERITQKQWDGVVERWNHLRPYERVEAREGCLANGHQWRDFPLPDRQICVVCCSYREP